MRTLTERSARFGWVAFVAFACAAVFYSVLKFAGGDESPEYSAQTGVPAERAAGDVIAPAEPEVAGNLPQPRAMEEEFASDDDSGVQSEADALSTLLAEEAAN